MKKSLGALIAISVAILLLILFPPALAFVELAARELRYLWWLILLVVFALWLIFGFGKRAK
ncbi:MAG: hypothetical protein AB1705_07805 [Verrucomicrobiota bacterium]